jgi:NTE family protein
MAALVLSGGGPVAVAWEAGLLAGFVRQGVTFFDTEFVLGTSAGAIVGAQLCCGVDPGAITDAILAEARGVPPPGGRPPPFDGEAAARLPALFRKAQDPAVDRVVARAEIGSYALAAPTESEEASIHRFAALVGEKWPSGRSAAWQSMRWTGVSTC